MQINFVSFPTGALLNALVLAHRQELIELAVRADQAAADATLGGPWTLTPGTDALTAMRPDLVRDFSRPDGGAIGILVHDTPPQGTLR